MSDIKIQPSATGSATVTLTAPVTNTARTITFPDSTSTLLASEGAVTINESGADLDFRVESDNDANALFVQGSDGNVGIGISTPTNPLTVEGDGARIAFSNTATYPCLGGISGFRSGTSHGNMYFETAGGGNFNTPVERMAIEGTTGEVKISTGDLIFGTANKGIVLGATTNVDANTLDDYEEGTWQPSFVAGSGSVTAHAAYSLCRYTKIGRVVQISGLVSCSGVSSPSGSLQMHGLPFAVDNNTSGETSGNAALAVGGITDLTASVTGLSMRPEPGTSYISIELFNGTSTTGNIADKWQNGTYFRFSGTYTV